MKDKRSSFWITIKSFNHEGFIYIVSASNTIHPDLIDYVLLTHCTFWQYWTCAYCDITIKTIYCTAVSTQPAHWLQGFICSLEGVVRSTASSSEVVDTSCPPCLQESEQCSLPGESLSSFPEMLPLCCDRVGLEQSFSARTYMCLERAAV